MSNLGGFSEEALKLFQLAASERGYDDFSEGDTYDFTRCVRPDGSAYGTRGRCKRGSEQAKGPEAKPAAKAPKVAAKAPQPVAGGGGAEAPAKPQRNYPARAETKAAYVKAYDAHKAAVKAEKEAEKAAKAAEKAHKKEQSAETQKALVEAKKRLSQAQRASDKAEKAMWRAGDKDDAARRREERAKETPAERKYRREQQRLYKIYG